jgi:hypothetical protein
MFYLFDDAKVRIVAIFAKYLGYSAPFCDEWTKYYDYYFVESRKECIFATRKFMFPVGIHKFSAQKHVYSVQKYKFSELEHKTARRRKNN